MSPSSLTTTTSQRRLKISSRNPPATPGHDSEISDDTIGRALSSPLFIQEREEPADRREAYHSYELPVQSFSVCHSRMGRLVHEPSSLGSTSEKNQVAKWKTKQSGSSLKDKKSKFSLILEPRFKDTNFKLIQIGEVSRNWMELSSLSEEKFITLLQVTNNFDEINNFCMNNYWNKIGIFVKLIWKVLMRWKI